MRLDLALVQRGLLPSRERAKQEILAGMVQVNGREVRKPSHEAAEGDAITLQAVQDYVGRGYLKLQKALDLFGIDVAGMACMDVGASTGGFTQLLLERGARTVHAIDVGTGQLAQRLRDDARVINMEQTDFRRVTREQVGTPDFACVDVSFISLRLILPQLYDLLHESGQAVCLLKPQFETGAPVKHGVVKDRKVHERVISALCDAAGRAGFVCCGLTHSPLTGGNGNIEFLLHLAKEGASRLPPADEVVRAAWDALVSQTNLATKG